VDGKWVNTEYRCRESADQDNFGGSTGRQKANKKSRDQMGSLKEQF